MTFKVQDPSDTLDYAHNWTDFLAQGDAIVSRQWTIEPDQSPSLLTNATSATVVVSGLTAGVVYRLAEKITTTNNVPIAEKSFTIQCENV